MNSVVTAVTDVTGACDRAKHPANPHGMRVVTDVTRLSCAPVRESANAHTTPTYTRDDFSRVRGFYVSHLSHRPVMRVAGMFYVSHVPVTPVTPVTHTLNAQEKKKREGIYMDGLSLEKIAQNASHTVLDP